MPDSIAASALDPAARRDLGGLQKDVAEAVARHLVAAGTLVDTDPEAALAHARYARRRASRIAVVREAAGIAAYHAGEWAEALAELRAARRMGGGPGHLPVMADVERAMGRPERAVELSRGPEARELPRAAQIELNIVVAGARRDLGELDAAVVALQIAELEPARRDPWSARLFYAYADNLLAAGRESDALRWFVHALDADPDGQTDASSRVAELSGEPAADEGIEFDLDDDLDDADDADDDAAVEEDADDAGGMADALDDGVEADAGTNVDDELTDHSADQAIINVGKAQNGGSAVADEDVADGDADVVAEDVVAEDVADEEPGAVEAAVAVDDERIDEPADHVVDGVRGAGDVPVVADSVAADEAAGATDVRSAAGTDLDHVEPAEVQPTAVTHEAQSSHDTDLDLLRPAAADAGADGFRAVAPAETEQAADARSDRDRTAPDVAAHPADDGTSPDPVVAGSSAESPHPVAGR